MFVLKRERRPKTIFKNMQAHKPQVSNDSSQSLEGGPTLAPPRGEPDESLPGRAGTDGWGVPAESRAHPASGTFLLVPTWCPLPLLVLDGHFTFRWACVITQECLADGMGGSWKPWSRLPLGFPTPPQPRAASPWALLPPCYENPVGPKDALLFPSYR